MPDDNQLWHAFREEAAGILGLTLSPRRMDCFKGLYAQLIDVNSRMNLTRITALPDFLRFHLLDSLSLAPYITETSGTLVDVGSGPGFPALPLAIVLPDLRVTAIESTRKKADFIAETAKALGLQNIQVLSERSEDLAHEGAYRARFDYATARAVASLKVLLELCLPFLKKEGRFFAMKTRSALVCEQADIGKALTCMGGQWDTTHSVALTGLTDRQVATFRKVAETPSRYPRNPAQIRQKPL